METARPSERRSVIAASRAGWQSIPVSCYYAVWLSDNPGPFIEDDGPQKGVIVTEVKDRLAPAPTANSFAAACSEFQLGWPRLSTVLPYLEDFDPIGWRSVSIGTQIFWTNREPNSFPPV